MSKEMNLPEVNNYTPDIALGQLFREVQLAQIFSDSKTFVDSVALDDPAEIVAMYESEKKKDGFSLKDFVQRHFLPPAKVMAGKIGVEEDMIKSLRKHWKELVRESKSTELYQSLINLPFPFVVPGGRFREMFYWDSYFTIIGLLESGEDELALGMLKNFEYLVNTYGYIPNGNRTYFLTRSQPPFFAEMLKCYAHKHGMESIQAFLPALEKEYHFWTKQDAEVNAAQVAAGKSVWLKGTALTRYTGTLETPRAEAWNKEYKWALALPEAERPAFHRNMRAACESGWDFSSRWFADDHNRLTCNCESLVPVCLNSILYGVELFLAEMHTHQQNNGKKESYQAKAQQRKAAVLQSCWWEEAGIFTDYDFEKNVLTKKQTLATVYPLFFGLATQQQANRIAKEIGEHFLKEGGVVTTNISSGEQWDAPNGWAPLQWLAVIGLHQYSHTDLAKTIAEHWLKVNEFVYHSESRMMEKYNVTNSSLPGGGGNYENQDGFGWTNGVALALNAWLNNLPSKK